MRKKGRKEERKKEKAAMESAPFLKSGQEEALNADGELNASIAPEDDNGGAPEGEQAKVAEILVKQRWQDSHTGKEGTTAKSSGGNVSDGARKVQDIESTIVEVKNDEEAEKHDKHESTPQGTR